MILWITNSGKVWPFGIAVSVSSVLLHCCMVSGFSPRPPTQTSQEDKGLLQGIFLPSLKSITLLLPNCIGRSCHKPAQNWEDAHWPHFFNEECQRILGPQFWLFSYARANKWHPPLGYTCTSLWGSTENLEWTIFICYETLVSPCSWNEGPVPVSLVPGPGALSAGEQWPERESRWRMWLGGGWDPGSVCLYFKSAPPLSLGIG